jgi:hypothetical protein
MRFFLKNQLQDKGLGVSVAEVVECLPSKHEA